MSSVLPDAEWRHRPGLDRLIEALGGQTGDTRYVGGIVRDTVLGVPAHDIDFATRLTPVDVVSRLETAGIKAIPTGLAHGTITAVHEGHSYEITTLRRDVTTDGRRATIAYTEDWQEDATRRDFTINALSADPISGHIYDYFGGLDDLRAGHVRFIGDALTRIAEDHLRIMRFFRFTARFAKGAPDMEALAACTARANDLMALSRERIADELLKILSLPAPDVVVRMMIESGIFRPVLPEITVADGLSALLHAEALSGGALDALPPPALRRLAALLPPDPKLAEHIAHRLKLSKAQGKRLVCLAARVPKDVKNPYALAYREGLDNARDRLLLNGADIATLADWDVPKFPLTGGALISLGLKPGPKVAATLKAIEAQWVAEGFPNVPRLHSLVQSALKNL